ncbi:hypothetical protein Arub01_25380 [Actinomadura rubrobrunea]|uniref:Type I-B CRISPR-associated protein Cas8b1/Cst1 n=1 Tax=Actinomadura rubrobrunea TaxID=115335 RepID=A0A9W6UUU0_9ACTN|nr:hypothetical protein [Actinomadura rubrobrunea]GLW64294.1 hypothetical protein Arub01_25380 [Actinomadura rubrobrunea]
MTLVAPREELRLSGHPVQHCGVWTVTLMAGRERPEAVTPADLDAVAGRVVDDVVTAATADNTSAAYDWWKVLFALYPNSKPTHATRSRDRAVLLPQVKALFDADEPGARPLPCTFCESPCGTLWSKSELPLFESARALNVLPPGTAGWPVCRGCRVALWALPYGAWVTQGSATVLTCDDENIERRYAATNLRRADRIRQLGFEGLPADAGPEAVALEALREHAGDVGGAATLWTFKNDNQDPWLRVASTRLGVVRFLRAMRADPQCDHGWTKLQSALGRAQRGRAKAVDGATAAARLLFDRENEDGERLPQRLVELARDPDKIPRRTLLAWRALCRLYLEVMCDMDAGRLKPVATLLADWIAKESTRGRFNEFRHAVDRSYDLYRLLKEASSRLALDGRPQEPINELFPLLFAEGPQGWRTRGQLYFDVMAELIVRDVPIGEPGDQQDDEQEQSDSDDYEEAYA